jgi:threonyl-tRNA synthetase
MSETIQVKLPDGSIKQFPKGATALDVAKSISPRLADAAIAAQAKPFHESLQQESVPPFAQEDALRVGHPSANPPGKSPPMGHPSVNGDEARLVDLMRPLEKDTELRILTEKDPESLAVFQH